MGGGIQGIGPARSVGSKLQATKVDATAACTHGNGILHVVDAIERSDVRVDVVGEGLVAHSRQTVVNGLECDAGQVQRKIDCVKQCNCRPCGAPAN